ncbi:uncharacterized protein [Choristoneura fumiferana]|uniref:uncharacterized protein n=1 Tax=Choristoneura fumiferana TaxID=7141 RepID=UPI003D15C092
MLDVTKFKLCVNCLRQGHAASACRMGPCRERDCNQQHNTLLHRPAHSTSNTANVNESEITVNYAKQYSSNQVLLSTAVIEVSNPLGQQKVKVRALLDCGSQSTFITESLKTRISLRSSPIDSLKVIGIGNTITNNVNENCKIKINSTNSDFSTLATCFVLKEVTGHLPKTPIDISSLKWPVNIRLADPGFNQPGPIDVLIGADLFWNILGNEQYSLGINGPKLRNSHLGWIISGPICPIMSNKDIHCNHVVTSRSNNENIENLITKFWELEEVPKGTMMNDGESRCESNFRATTTRTTEGRFSVRLPLKESADCLGDTYNLAKQRFIKLEKRLKRNSTLKVQYTKFINEYADLKHLSFSNSNHNFNLNPCYYLCHHAVFKQESESTKLRVVFDGSAPSTSGYSLNDILLVGPNVQDSLFSILIRARQYKYLLTGDIEKMYRQVLVDEDDRHLQLILWRENESQPIQTLILNTLTYGTASASYLSTRCLWQLGEEQNDELIKNIIQKDFYVDDLITGSNDLKQLIHIRNSISEALSSGCFNLRKYKSNCQSILENIENNKQDNFTISESSSTLGLGWNPCSDTLHFPIKHCTIQNKEITKRVIMSNSFKIFDPLGILSPVVIIPKIMLQRLWQQKLDWDQPVPEGIKADWIKFCDNLKYLTNLQIPRLVLGDSPKTIELHSFSDASQIAYGACIYMRTISHNDEVKVKLLCSKSKVAPLKPTTIPRLELCAALLAAKLTKSVQESLRYQPDKIVHWCDSSVVLAWIKGDVTRLKIFVANRISEITELTSPLAWRYVPTDMNPADLISKGVDAKQLLSRPLWWAGPMFLLKGETVWPIFKDNDLATLPELKVHSAAIIEPVIDFDRYSSFSRLQRIFAYVKRFTFNLKNKNNKRVGILSTYELCDSFHALCIIAQKQSFQIEYELLSKGKPLNSKNKIISLSPFLDKEKVIRVGGRLDASSYSYEKKHPILLHSSHRLTKLFFAQKHIEFMHAGPQLLLATIRETVWPINGRHLARRTVNNCVRCRRLRGKTLQPKMGNLPPQRVNPDYPFLSVGLDFAGPFFIVNRKGRGSRLIKCYLCLFVCLRYKCIHLEAVSDLTKDAFIMSLRRFISRRGKPIEILCDNGTNFVAAAKEVGSFIKQSHLPLSDFASQQSIKFMFIPAYSPHFGGIWEAGVKSAKHHLKRVIGLSHLTFEEISTLFAQVEAILNSRPLCPLSSCPNDLLSLSPGHFIIGRPLTAPPSPNLEDCSENQLKRYERVEKIRQHFWRRWQREYISEMQQRTKWKTSSAKLNIGDMVLLAEDNVPPLSWSLGRVQRLITGTDGVARVADVTTTKGCVRRSLVRLCKLPTAEELQC